MDILKKEIERKRKQLEEAKLLDENPKCFKRSKYIAKQQEDYFTRNGYQHVQILEEKQSIAEADTGKTSNDVDKPNLSRREVTKRLRERGEPITLFGETELDSYRRLHQLEMSSTDINKGFRNDFQAAMDQVDQAYLSEMFKAQPDDSNKSTNDVSVQDLGITMEEISTKTKKLGRGNEEIDCQMLLDFLQLLLSMWGQKLNSRTEEDKRSVKGKLDSATYSQTQAYLKPLFRKLKTQSLPEDILDSLRDIYVHLLDRHYVKANDAYLQMAIGNAPWPIGVTMVGIHARTGREKIFSKNVAHVLNDETQRKYIQALKRLMTKCQEFFPTAPSRSVEYKGEH